MSRDLPRVRTPSRRALRSPTSARGRGYGDEDPEEEFPVTPEDAAELARIEAEEAKDREADEQNIAAYERAAERRKAQTRFAAFLESLEAPVGWFNDVYDNPNALMVFPPESALRRACEGLRTHPTFEGIVFACVILNGVNIGLTIPEAQLDAGVDPILPTAVTKTFEIMFLLVFAAEAVIKIIAQGFLIGEDHYLRSYWNILDFTVQEWQNRDRDPQQVLPHARGRRPLHALVRRLHDRPRRRLLRRYHDLSCVLSPIRIRGGDPGGYRAERGRRGRHHGSD